MNTRIAAKIINGHHVDRVPIGGRKWQLHQYHEAHLRTAPHLIRRFGLEDQAKTPTSDAARAIFGGRYFKTMEDKPLYLLDLNRKRAVLPIVKTARQEHAVLAALHRLATARYAVGSTDATLTLTQLPPQAFQQAVIVDADAFLATCGKSWKDWPVVLAVDFTMTGLDAFYTTVEFTDEQRAAQKADSLLAEWRSNDPFSTPSVGALAELVTAEALCRIAAGIMRATGRQRAQETTTKQQAEQDVEPMLPVNGTTRPIAVALTGKRLRYAGTEYTIGVGEYASGRLHVVLFKQNAETNHCQVIPQITTDTIPDTAAPLGEDEIYVRTTNEHEELARAALASGYFEDTGRSVQSGWSHVSVWRIAKPATLAFDLDAAAEQALDDWHHGR